MQNKRQIWNLEKSEIIAVDYKLPYFGWMNFNLVLSLASENHCPSTRNLKRSFPNFIDPCTLSDIWIFKNLLPFQIPQGNSRQMCLCFSMFRIVSFQLFMTHVFCSFIKVGNRRRLWGLLNKQARTHSRYGETSKKSSGQSQILSFH